MPPARAVLLDLDGTMLDSIGLILAAFRHAFTVHRGAPPPDAAWLAGVGTPLEVQLRGLARPGEDVAALLATYRDFAIARHDALARPFPGIPEAVRGLRARGVALAVVTSKRREGVERGLRLCGLLDAFDAWICPEDVVRPKPHPEPVLLALERLGVAAAEAFFVGDSPHDLQAGRAAGVRPVAVRWGPFEPALLEAEGPERWLERPEDLLTLVQGPGA